ncbi:uncharacterized protein CIMG_09639 [Coccidioides immitis RS]|uniref:Fatty acid hydroxylase domain-containing protein n=1 Tax=Coccidioides immitis (strain RS) TaxID=246410 RepID=J3K2T9_COCIM|nr:uncharacterized protein CIMG_09639 [Coccidioides immitis RS]EAS28435.3 hypothetical protein CIMG_09639 [Coccidioides immitis RS]TPX23241.1 hypothetical protein DIZ76_012567 [Coccidioides immitis]
MTIPLSVWFPRVILLAIVCTGILWPSAWQPVVSALYRYLYTWPFFNRSFFETVETVLCYITIEPIYTARFARNPSRRIDVRDGANSGNKARPKLPKMKRPSRRLRELLIYVSPLLLLDLTLIKKYAGVDINAIRVSGGYPPASPTTPGHIKTTFLAPTLHRFSWKSPLQLVRALPHEPPTSRRVLLELAVSLFIYDALFFVIHIAFHRIRALHRIHGPHHGHLEIHPQVTNRLSVAERVSLILLANFSLNIIGSHVLTRTLFVPVFVYLLIEVHSGVDLDWQYDKILPQGWGAGPRKHALHHREGKRFYQPFFCWWDNWLESLEGARID